MTIEEDLERIALQETGLRFPRFDADTAWDAGSRLRAACAASGAAVAIDIRVNGHQLFFSAMEGTTPDHIDWIRRKINVVQRFHRSSYAIGLELRRDRRTLAEKCGASVQDHAPNGGCFPIRLQGTGCIGTISVSGLPQRTDHELIVGVLCEMLGKSYEDLKLDPSADPN